MENTTENTEQAKERIKKARIQIQVSQPFFAYLSLYMKFKENNKIETMGVDTRGNIDYNSRFVNSLNIEELKFVILHEIMHVAMRHFLRKGGRNHTGWNFATDLSINPLIRENGYKAPMGGLLPDYYDNFDFQGYIIENVSKKNAEKIYSELEDEWKKRKEERERESKNRESEDSEDSQDNEDNEDNERITEGKWKGSKKGWNTDTFVEMFGDYEFDIHDYENLTETEKEQIEKEWKDRVIEAITSSKMAGNLPKGLERLIDEIHNEKIDWRSALNKYISNMIVTDYCYSKPHKRSKSVGTYLPHLKKESIEIGVMVDLSGSVGQEEYKDFMSEVVGIARAYRERIKIHFFSHDTKGYYNGVVDNGNIEKIMKIEMKGGGGTCFNEPSKFITEQNRNLKAIVWLTDGYGTEIKEKPSYDILWVLEKDGSEELCKYGRVIRL